MSLKLVSPQEDLAFELPLRPGPRPTGASALPHIQLDQWPPSEIAEELFVRCLGLPNVRPKQSRMASPDCQALTLPDKLSAGPSDAFIVDHEFCHLHPLPYASIHLTLPKQIRQRAIRQNWAEQHLASRAGILPETLVLVYAPRNLHELAIVFQLVWHSNQFAMGLGTEYSRRRTQGEAE
jgi:hypothetical protein